jgi:hypothetical protein
MQNSNLFSSSDQPWKQIKANNQIAFDSRSEISSRPMSKAYSAIRGNPNITKALMIPKSKIKKKPK